MSVMSSFSDRFEHVTDVFERFWGVHGKLIKIFGVVCGVGLTLHAVRALLEYKTKRAYQDWSKENPDTVILHQPKRGNFAPSISPFPLKLETYLRLAKINYTNDFNICMGPKGKTPFITINGEDIPDSQHCIEYLNKKFQINLNKAYNEVDIAVGEAFRVMLDDSLYWTMALDRWVYSGRRQLSKIFSDRKIVCISFLIGHKIQEAAYGHGIGRHSEEQIKAIAYQELKTLSTFLGKKKFLLGDNISEVDCSIFGFLAQLVWNFPESYLEKIVKDDFPNLEEYCLRMKETVWPDWDQCLATAS